MAEDRVVKFYPANAANDPDNVLELAVGHYDQLMIIGWSKYGSLDVRSTNTLTEADHLLMLEIYKTQMLNTFFSDE